LLITTTSTLMLWVRWRVTERKIKKMEGIEAKGSHKSFVKQRHRCFNLFTSKREEIDCSFVQHPCFHTIVTQCFFFLFSQISFIYLGFYHLFAFCLLVFLLFRKTKFNDASKRNRRNILNIFFFIDFSLLFFLPSLPNHSQIECAKYFTSHF